ncbi:MAG: hypothetical protein Q4Q07_09565 [Tissierellia bacterium]|nr:hypothetical protein [Tissierellia bacterium]
MNQVPKYPFLLIHGAGYENEFPLPYWGRIPKTLEDFGCTVYLCETGPWDSMVNNGEKVANEVKRMVDKIPCEKVNLIGHSRGGLEARVSTHMGAASYISSITTICAPHYGCDYIPELVDSFKFRLYNRIVDSFWTHIRKTRTDAKKGIMEMTPEAMIRFNEKYTDIPGIYYQSYGALIEEYRGDWPRYILYRILADTGENNDGLVSPESANWGEYKETLRHCSHQYLADTFQLDDGGVNVPEFYLEIVKDLAQRGF